MDKLYLTIFVIGILFIVSGAFVCGIEYQIEQSHLHIDKYKLVLMAYDNDSENGWHRAFLMRIIDLQTFHNERVFVISGNAPNATEVVLYESLGGKAIAFADVDSKHNFLIVLEATSVGGN